MLIRQYIDSKIVILAVIIIVSCPVYAFKPDVTSEVPIIARANNSKHSHVGITDSALKTTSVNSFDEEIKFSTKAIETIKNNNKLIDSRDRTEFSDDPIYHCDNERVLECSSLIFNKKDNIIGLLLNKPPRGNEARIEKLEERSVELSWRREQQAIQRNSEYKKD